MRAANEGHAFNIHDVGAQCSEKIKNFPFSEDTIPSK
jgi:hypothetical protein